MAKTSTSKTNGHTVAALKPAGPREDGPRKAAPRKAAARKASSKAAVNEPEARPAPAARTAPLKKVAAAKPPVKTAAKAAAKLREVEAQPAGTPDEVAEQQRKKAVIAAAIERARVRKEEMAARSGT